MGKKKKNSSIPRHKRMKRPARLQVAKHWIPTYSGKNIVRGYARHFGVDLLCAVIELELLGYKFTLEYKEKLKRNKEDITKQKQARKRAKQEKERTMHLDQNENFYYIVGYTSGGAPYGVTWEEIEHDEYELFKKRKDGKSKGKKIHESTLLLVYEEDDIPF